MGERLRCEHPVEGIAMGPGQPSGALRILDLDREGAKPCEATAPTTSS